ncbi:hypothetical protein [Variovorax paradoxus]|uniref:hypothetical protein n=1 Tax=Variovorax paradoxus TaxID=34073 RepID=UPI001934885C|nr:hypothetical protein INQ48_18055 [Variovorax paradoxus]
MTDINQLSSVDQISLGDLVPIFSISGGTARKLPLTAIAAAIAELIGVSQDAQDAREAAAAAQGYAASAGTQAAIATAGATTATTQAGIATVQAGVATTQAANSLTSATSAATSADIAAARGRTYATAAAGVNPAGTPAGVGLNEYFTVPSSDPQFSLDLYQNVAGSAVLQAGKSVPSTTRLKTVTELLYGAAEFTNNGFILATGAFASSPSWGATGFLEILGGEAYVVYSQCIGSARHCWYDKDKVLISAFGGAEPTFQALTATAPANARYLRVSAQQWPVTSAYVQGSVAAYNIRKQKQITTQHPVSLSSTLVDDNGTPLNVTLTALAAAQLASDTRIAALVGELDLATDAAAPLFVNLWQYTKSWAFPATFNAVAVASRDSANQFTVASGGGSNFIAGGALVVENGATGEITSFVCKSVVGDVVTVIGTLPATLGNAQGMWDSANTQHLSRLAQKGLADFIISRTQRYAYKKSTIFEYHPPTCSTPSAANANIYTLDNTTLKVAITKLGNAGFGGFVPGTTNLAKLCQTRTDPQYNVGVAGDGVVGEPTQYLGYGYDINSAAAGDGIEFTIPAGRNTGFLEIPIAARTGAYTSSVDGTSQTFDGKARLVVLGDGVTIHDQVYEAGRVHYVFVDFAGYSTLTVRLMNAENKVTALRLCAVYAYTKSAATPTSGFFKSGDVVAFLMDSWGAYPVAVGGEVPPLRPDGSTADGMQFTSERLRTQLASQGVSVTTLNMSKGGQTSEWGLYWADKILELRPKVTHCFTNFAINDSNSRTAYDADTDSAYDFDPVNMWVNKVKSAGGKKGSTNDTRWYSNTQAICDRLSKAGIKPVVLMPPSTASTSQTQSIRSNLLHKIARGFRGAA